MKIISRIALFLAGVLLAGVVAILAGIFLFNRRMTRETRDLFAQAVLDSGPTVGEEQLTGLPRPVQTYLRQAGVVGRPIPATVRLEMNGRIREDEQQPWMAFTAEEYYTTQPPAFQWHARARMGSLPAIVHVRDNYTGGQSNLLVNFAGLFAMSDGRGPDVDQGGLMRYLNEMVLWFPAASLLDNVAWEAVDAHTARVSLSDSGATVSALVSFDEQGRLANFTADRYRAAGTPDSSFESWSTPVDRFQQFEGLQLPTHGRGVWHLEGGDLTYIEMDITSIAYNVPAP